MLNQQGHAAVVNWQHQTWSFPKGHVEDGENIARTAHREVREETGLDGRILDKIGHIEYFFTFKDEHETKRFFKIVYFFLMEYTSGSVDGHDDEVDECRWVDIEKAVRLMRYDDEKGIIRKAKKLIKAHRKEGSAGKKPEGEGGRL